MDMVLSEGFGHVMGITLIWHVVSPIMFCNFIVVCDPRPQGGEGRAQNPDH